jgi:hypothetical protein
LQECPEFQQRCADLDGILRLVVDVFWHSFRGI